MKNKAYIVANEQQEREVLEKLEQEAVTWWLSLKPASQFIPSKYSPFPYGLKILGSYVVFASLDRLEGYEIVFDGRKEEQMSEKYVVSQEFMNKLEGWKIGYVANSGFLDTDNIGNLPPVVSRWWIYADITDKERNNRLIAIIRWVNGEDVFEIEKPKKWVVRSKEPQGSVDGEPLYIWFVDELTLETETEATMPPYIRRFNTKEEAQSWANSHQEVVSVEE